MNEVEKKLKPLSADDIAVCVYTSALNLRERALSVQNTWLKDFKNGYLIGGWYHDPALKMISLVPSVGEDYNSAHKKQFMGLVELYQRCPEAKWFYITGCDAFLFSNNLVALLTEYDAATPIFIGGHCGSATIDGQELIYPSGGPGFALSISLVASLVEHIPEFISTWEKRSDGYASACDVALTYLVKMKSDINLTYRQGFYHNPPYRYPDNTFKNGYGEDVNENVVSKPIAFHTLSIREMYALRMGKRLEVENHFARLFDAIIKKFGRLFHTKKFINVMSKICLYFSGNRKQS